MATSLASHVDLGVLLDVGEGNEQRDQAHAALLTAGAPEVVVIGPADGQEEQALHVA